LGDLVRRVFGDVAVEEGDDEAEVFFGVGGVGVDVAGAGDDPELIVGVFGGLVEDDGLSVGDDVVFLAVDEEDGPGSDFMDHFDWTHLAEVGGEEPLAREDGGDAEPFRKGEEEEGDVFQVREGVQVAAIGDQGGDALFLVGDEEGDGGA